MEKKSLSKQERLEYIRKRHRELVGKHTTLASSGDIIDFLEAVVGDDEDHAPELDHIQVDDKEE